MNLIPAPVPQGSDTEIRDLMEGLFRRETPLKSVFGPQFMTICPPLLPCEDELVWFDITNPVGHKPLFDYNMIETQNSETEAKKLINLAFKQALNLQDQKALENELDKDSDLVYHIGLTSKKVSTWKYIKKQSGLPENLYSNTKYFQISNFYKMYPNSLIHPSPSTDVVLGLYSQPTQSW